jgi:hypothetical protein
MSIKLEDQLPTLSKKRRFSKKELAAMKEHEQWEDSEEARDMVLGGMLGQGEFEDLFPQDYGKALHPTGNWIQVQKPPHCEITVPPFSIWFAEPWPTEAGVVCGVHAKRAKIVTPKGTLGLWPHEFSVVEDMTHWIGREDEGVMVRTMNDRPAMDKEQLFYLMSRGITRQRAALMLINQIKDPTFLWIEIAPQYGEYFGREWPTPERCPFAASRESWIAIQP